MVGSYLRLAVCSALRVRLCPRIYAFTTCRHPLLPLFARLLSRSLKRGICLLSQQDLGLLCCSQRFLPRMCSEPAAWPRSHRALRSSPPLPRALPSAFFSGIHATMAVGSILSRPAVLVQSNFSFLSWSVKETESQHTML